MNIVWINQFAQLLEHGGGTRHIELAMELTKRYGINATIIAGNKNYLSGKRIFDREGCYNIDGVKFCVIEIAYKIGYVRRAYSWLEFAIKLWKFKKIFKEADIIIGSSPTLFATYSALRIARKYRKPFILEIRDLWPEILRDSRKLSDKSPLYIIMDRISKTLYKNSEYIITLCRGQKEYIKDFTKSPIEVVYNGMSDILIKNQSPQKFKGFNIVYAGALGYANDIETIVKTADLLKSIKDIKFHILGDGPYRRIIQKAIEQGLSNLVYHGLLAKEEAFRVMSSCHVGLLTLRNEIPLFRYGVSPNKLFDYLSLGLYVVSTVEGEIEEIVKASKSGITVKPEDLVSVIKQLYKDFMNKPYMFSKSNGKEFVRQNYSRKKMAEQLLNIIKKIK